jgi:glycosyltransferase involved in cell wall biosynthesis
VKIAAIIPCYKVKAFIKDVIDEIPTGCEGIYIVDDKCPQETGKFVEDVNSDPRVKVLYNAENQGVGGAVLRGYEAAYQDGYDIFVKIDGDGQMPPSIMANICEPILNHRADYSKGNRFNSFYNVRSMPFIRLFGNSVLSFLTKLSSGYWSIFDPTNGYTALHREAYQRLSVNNLAKRYFFETDMLIQLRNISAVVEDVPMEAKYGDEESGLKIRSILLEFFTKHIRMTIRRFIYQYFLRDFSLASFHLLLGLIMLLIGGSLGIALWVKSINTGLATPTGTIMLSALPSILGFQSIIFALGADVASEPKTPLQNKTVPKL